MEKHYKIEWYRPDGTLQTQTHSFEPLGGSLGGEGYWGDVHTQQTFSNPLTWFEERKADFLTRWPEAEAKLLCRVIGDWEKVD